MSTPRPYQFIALRRLAAGGRQSRQLHMTGPATASTILTERSASNLPRDIAGLRAECKRRKLEVSRSKHELTSRLSANDLTHSRAFTTAINASKRPIAETNSTGPVRHFNTSRTLKAVGDSSTLDFNFLPDLYSQAGDARLRVPLLPENDSTSHAAEAGEAAVMRPEISSMSADGAYKYSAMSDVHDNNAMPIDFHAVADRVSATATEAVKPVVESTSMLKQLWNGMLDDVFGPKAKGSTS